MIRDGWRMKGERERECYDLDGKGLGIEAFVPTATIMTMGCKEGISSV
jgi:hypothetical protein